MPDIYARAHQLAHELAVGEAALDQAIFNVGDFLRKKRARPGWVAVPSFSARVIGPIYETIMHHAVLWDGRGLLYDNGQIRIPLTSASREEKTRAADILGSLANKLLEEWDAERDIPRHDSSAQRVLRRPRRPLSKRSR